MKNCSHCGGCDSCGGCGRSLSLTEPELRLLQKFSQLPFLPVARKSSEETPVFLEEDAPDTAAALVCLEKKGLIDIDYHLPLSGFDYSAYSAYPLHGSMALTARGQEVLDTIDLQGIEQD